MNCPPELKPPVEPPLLDVIVSLKELELDPPELNPPVEKLGLEIDATIASAAFYSSTATVDKRVN